MGATPYGFESFRKAGKPFMANEMTKVRHIIQLPKSKPMNLTFGITKPTFPYPNRKTLVCPLSLE